MAYTRTIANPSSTCDTQAAPHVSPFEYPLAASLTKDAICGCIEDTGVMPSICDVTPEGALFVADTLIEAGIPIVEVSMNFPDAINIVAYLAKHAPMAIVGAGNVRNVEMGRACVEAGARFLATDGAIPGLLEFTAKENLATILGALTLSEVIAAWDGGADFVKVVPCFAVGGHNYIRTLKTAIPQARLIAAGGVNQLTALNYATAGVAALSVGKELIPDETIDLRQTRRIQELARRFLSAMDAGRV